MTNKAIKKFNNGIGAILCSSCRVIIREGKELTKEDLSYLKGDIELEAQYCGKCNHYTDE